MVGPYVAIVDYGLGNLFSVKEACRKVGLKGVITSSAAEIKASSAVILTGVGAFGIAMNAIKELRLIDVLRETASSGKPLLGICLGMQLLMTESSEFGRHTGLDIIKGRVVRLDNGRGTSKEVKVPHVGWNHIEPAGEPLTGSWQGTLLEGLKEGCHMYFVHSYIVELQDKEASLSETRYGVNEFCSAIQFNNITAFQFHPECSGPNGLMIYRRLAAELKVDKVFRKNKEIECAK